MTRAWWGALLLAACAREPGPASAPGPEPAARVEAERGPVRIVAELTPAPLRLSERARLVVRVEHERGVELLATAIADRLGAFAAVDERPPDTRVEGGRTAIEHRWTLEPTDEGEQELGPFSVRFRTAPGREAEVATGPLRVVVGASVPLAEASLDALEGPLAPVVPPPPPRGTRTPGGWVAAGAALAFAAAAALWRRRRRARAVPPPTPTELAARELAALRADDPLARGEVQTFFSELTLIVRRYVERTTGIRAPEMTTPEFLRTMGRRPGADDLRPFLEAADLVKFAGQRPDRAAVDAAVGRARALVGLAPGPAAGEAAA